MIVRLVALAAALAAVSALPAQTAAAPASATAAKGAVHAKRAGAPCGRAARRAAAHRTRCASLRRPRRLATGGPLERLLGVGPGRSATPGPTPGPDEPQGPGSEAPALSRFVSVAAREFSLTLSRPLVGTGAVTVELRNNGEDPHNLIVSPEGTHTPLAAFSEIDPATYERRSVTLEPGRYQLWCSLESHEGLGMTTTLRVQ
jgi:hypothetical protein